MFSGWHVSDDVGSITIKWSHTSLSTNLKTRAWGIQESTQNLFTDPYRLDIGSQNEIFPRTTTEFLEINNVNVLIFPSISMDFNPI